MNERQETSGQKGFGSVVAILIGGLLAGLLGAEIAQVVETGSGSICWVTAGFGVAAGVAAAPFAESVLVLVRHRNVEKETSQGETAETYELSGVEKHRLRLFCPLVGLLIALIAKHFVW